MAGFCARICGSCLTVSRGRRPAADAEPRRRAFQPPERNANAVSLPNRTPSFARSAVGTRSRVAFARRSSGAERNSQPRRCFKRSFKKRLTGKRFGSRGQTNQQSGRGVGTRPSPVSAVTMICAELGQLGPPVRAGLGLKFPPLPTALLSASIPSVDQCLVSLCTHARPPPQAGHEASAVCGNCRPGARSWAPTCAAPRLNAQNFGHLRPIVDSSAYWGRVSRQDFRPSPYWSV